MATRDLPMDPADHVTRLANRAAALAFASGFAIIVALVAVASVFPEGDPGPRLAAFGALVLAAGVTAWAWRTRVELRAARDRSERSPRSSDGDGEIVGASRRRPKLGAAASPQRSRPGRRSPPREPASVD